MSPTHVSECDGQLPVQVFSWLQETERDLQHMLW